MIFYLIVGTASAPLSPAPGSKSLPPLPEIPSNKPVPKPRPKEKKIYVAAYDYKPCEEGDLELIAVSALLCMLGNFSCFCCHLPTFFINNFFQKNYFRNTDRVSNGLDPDQDQHCVGPDLGPNYLQRLSAGDRSLRYQLQAKSSTSSLF